MKLISLAIVTLALVGISGNIQVYHTDFNTLPNWVHPPNGYVLENGYLEVSGINATNNATKVTVLELGNLSWFNTTMKVSEYINTSNNNYHIWGINICFGDKIVLGIGLESVSNYIVYVLGLEEKTGSTYKETTIFSQTVENPQVSYLNMQLNTTFFKRGNITINVTGKVYDANINQSVNFRNYTTNYQEIDYDGNVSLVPRDAWSNGEEYTYSYMVDEVWAGVVIPQSTPSPNPSPSPSPSPNPIFNPTKSQSSLIFWLVIISVASIGIVWFLRRRR